jgi:hypothetical protein
MGTAPPQLGHFSRSDFAIDSQLFGGWERRFTTLAGAIHNFEALIHTLIHNFWQGNGTNGDLSAEIAIPTVRPRLTSPVSR